MFILELHRDPQFFFAVVITVVVSITIHELAHGVVAIWRGDRTPVETGHMTLNPAVHLGPFSVIALLMAGIAWGAMPINPGRIRGRYGEALVAVAGPVSNALLALISLTALGLWWRQTGHSLERGTPAGNFQYLLQVFGLVNIVLAVFNLIPVPPLDGSKILENVSTGYRDWIERLHTTGASVLVLIFAFVLSGRVIFPAAQQMRLHWLELVSGLTAFR
jgi:Zn-dependent protease